jgi:hypothetical protein
MLIATDTREQQSARYSVGAPSSAAAFSALRILRNHEEADDAVQNCLVLASRNLPRRERQSVFKVGWREFLLTKRPRFSEGSIRLK